VLSEHATLAIAASDSMSRAVRLYTGPLPAGHSGFVLGRAQERRVATGCRSQRMVKRGSMPALR
jgi:hypothetical protein